MDVAKIRMELEEELLGSIERDLSTCVAANLVKERSKALASARSLIVNPSTSVSTLTSLLQALLSRSRTLHPHQLLTLLSDLSLRHPHLSPLVRHHARSLLLDSHSTRLAAQSFALIAAESQSEEEEAAFVSLCFRPSVSMRPWLLSNAGRFRVRPSLLLTVLLGFTKDPYPRVRRAALDGLVTLCRAAELEDRALVQGCYFRAGELLRDMEDCIRVSAIRAVSEWGLKLVALHEEANKRYWSDAVFLKLCCMVRDMSVKVRVEAFNALGQMKIVTENIMLQALHKRVDEKYFADQCSAVEFEKQAPNIAGAFVHGLEDEFYEVRNSACQALRALIILSSKFAGEALNLLMDVLNDDSLIVRLQALKTMCHMATYISMTVQETHKHMFLGTLCDSSTLVRFEARKILTLIKVNFNVFKSCVNRLLENLETYPQDEADIFNVLFKFGHAHGYFVLRFISKAFPELIQIDSPYEGKIDIDNTKVAAALVLAISVPLAYKKPDDGDPDRQRIFLYSVAFLGRFSCALNDVMSQSTLLDYLLHYSNSTTFPAAEFEVKSEDPLLTLHEVGVPEYTSGQPASPVVEHPSVHCNEVTNYLDVILSQTKDQWQFVQSGRISEAMRILRIFKKELGTYSTDCLLHTGAITFVAEYLRVVKLLARAWGHFLNPTKLTFFMRDLDLVLGKLNRKLREMRYRFIELSKGEELHVLELILVSCIYRLSKAGNGIHHHSTLKKFSATVYHAKSLCVEQSIEPSEFVIENVKLCNEYDNFINEDCYRTSLFKQLLNFFSLKGFVLSKSLKHIKADLDVQGYDSLHPLAFISGLPVGIPFEITLYNILGDKKLWLSMAVDEEFTQYVFLDLNQFENCDGIRKLTFTAPFYKTPKVVSFRIKVFIGMECDLDEVHFVKGFGGPKHELVHLCQEREVYLSMLNI